MKKVSILGSTGSVGQNALQVIRSFPGRFGVLGLAAGRNVELLADQIAEFRPEVVSVMDANAADRLSDLLRARQIDPRALAIGYGIDGAVAVATHPGAELVLSAISGASGLIPTYRAIEAGKNIALANKETLVAAGSLMMSKARQKGIQIIPVDSEHNAIHQCLRGERQAEIRRLILTASGGPFRTVPKEQLHSVTPEQALAHPTWRMGRKISIDSATLMNKGLEIIEASWLFGVTADEVDILIHPQSIVHSLVELIDGSVIAQLGITDMRLAIQYALTYPERWDTPLPRLDLTKIKTLEFCRPDYEKFPSLALSYQALRAGGTMPAVLNAANEVAVSAFLARQIRFTQIPEIISETMRRHVTRSAEDLETILAADREARSIALSMLPEIMAAQSGSQT